MAEQRFGEADGVDLTHRSDSDIVPDPECSEAVPTEGLHVDYRKKSSNMMDQADKENYSLAALSDLMLEDRSSDDNSESQKRTGSLPNYTSSSDPRAPANISARPHALLDDEEVVRMAKEEGLVAVVFPGRVTQDSCCKFVCEILKCVLYQRQQLPMMYDQLVYYQKKQQATGRVEDAVSWQAARPGGWDWRKCQRTLQDLDEVVLHLQDLFSLSRVPRVLLMLGGSVVLPTELYEVDMEALAAGIGDGYLRTAPCLRQLFRALFVADILSDARPVRLMATTVMALAHRDCGVDWFRPKLDYRVPTRVKRQVISLSSELALSQRPTTQAWEDYVWFQAPVSIKGFCK
ncbi:MAD2L1-binding protein [Brienomyrus brachyistius]|uniref:MAD2L1-binding protein n=1 Tax=Brienomyrus brachyistius TaxID=42636 RepID=UPI0020B352EE|nr:MAD2L1-binding protein [Brienomyrus brachyistius]